MLYDGLQRDDIRLVLVAAADVIFSDGVSEAFINQWVAETAQLLLLRRQLVPAVAH